jgi:hypothetical protein
MQAKPVLLCPKHGTCESFQFIALVVLLLLVLLYIIIYLISAAIVQTEAHDTISSSIFDANKVHKRAFNISLGFLTFIMICLYLDEYDSRKCKHSYKYLGLYIVEILSFLVLGFVGIFPGGHAYRKSAYYLPAIDRIHLTVSILTLLLINATNIFYAVSKLVHPWGISSLVLSAISVVGVLIFAFLSATKSFIAAEGPNFKEIENPWE